MAASSDANKGSTTSPPNPQSPTAQPPNELITIAITLLATFIAVRVLISISSVLAIFAAPVAALYLMQTCPTNGSFDVKRELKRVLRGDNLPEDHPDKPKGFFEKTVAKVNAAIGAEAATITGYSTEIIDVLGFVKICIVRSPSTKMDFYWLGAVNKWRFIMSKDLNVERPKTE